MLTSSLQLLLLYHRINHKRQSPTLNHMTTLERRYTTKYLQRQDRPRSNDIMAQTLEMQPCPLYTLLSHKSATL